MTASLVQSKSGSTTTGSPLTVTFTSAVTAGNAVVVGIGATQGTSSPTVSSVTLGSTNLTKANNLGGGTSQDVEFWILANAPSGQTVVTITFTGGSGGSIELAAWCMEWSGMATSSLLDKAPAGGTGTSTSFSSNSTGTLTNANEVVFGAAVVATLTGTVTAPGTPWTELATLGSSTTLKLVVGYQVVSATTAQTYSGTISASSTWQSIIISLNQASSNVTVSITNASVSIGASAVTPDVTVPITAAAVNIAAQRVNPLSGIFVQINAATVSVAAQPVTPKVTVPIAHASVSIAAQPITPHISRNLILSIAGVAGTDNYGNPYPAGFYCTTGQVNGQIIAQSTIQNGTLAQGAIDGYEVNALTVNSGVVSASDVIVSGTAGGLFAYSSGGTIVDTFTTSGTWKCPAGVTSIQVVCIGGGGGGGGTNSSLGPGGGGGGAEYASESSVAVTPGNTYTYTVGAAGTGGGSGTSNGTAGGNSVFTGDTKTVTAHGGSGGNSANSFGLGGSGGSGSTNSVHFNGGAGSSATNGNLGAGGSSGGSSSAGNPGNGVTGQGGVAVTGGGPGGNVDNSPVSGSGGGGGGYGTVQGANGWTGKVVITYTSSSPQLIASIAGLATSDPIASGSVPEGIASDHVSVNTTGSAPSTPSGRCVFYYDGSALWALGTSGTAVKLATT